MKPLPILLVLSAIALTNCAQSPQGNPKLMVAIPENCDRLARPLPPPQPVKTTDAGVAAAEYAAWGQANALRLRSYEACNKRVRGRFANGA